METYVNILVKNIEKNEEKILRLNPLQNVYTIKRIIA